MNKALSIDSRNVEGLVARGALYANSGSFKKAVEDFENALKLNPAHANARKYMGETLVALGRSYEDENNLEAAKKAYQDCLMIIPHHEEAQTSLDFLKNKMKAPLLIEPAELQLPEINFGDGVALKKDEPGKRKEKGKNKKRAKEKKNKKKSYSSSSSSSEDSDDNGDKSSSDSSSDSSSNSSSSSGESEVDGRRTEGSSGVEVEVFDISANEEGTMGQRRERERERSMDEDVARVNLAREPPPCSVTDFYNELTYCF